MTDENRELLKKMSMNFIKRIPTLVTAIIPPNATLFPLINLALAGTEIQAAMPGSTNQLIQNITVNAMNLQPLDGSVTDLTLEADMTLTLTPLVGKTKLLTKVTETKTRHFGSAVHARTDRKSR